MASIALAAAEAHAQGMKSCPLIDLADAAQLTGKGTEFYSANEGAPGADGKKPLFCTFGGGADRTLTVRSGPSLAKTAADYQKMVEPLRQMDKGAVEPGLGEYAHSKVASGEALLTAVKGTRTITLELKGKDVGPADLAKLRTAMQKALTKL
jgi:hypothetical protein